MFLCVFRSNHNEAKNIYKQSINGLYQQTSTPSVGVTVYQKIVIEADIAVNILIIATYLSSFWTICIQFGVNNHHLIGHHRYIQCNSTFLHSMIVPLLLFSGGVLIIITYFVGLPFIQIEYSDSWDLYDVVFDQKRRKYDFISVIEDIERNNNSNNNDMLMTFYYFYVIFVPIVCYIGYTTLCLVLRCNRTQIRRIILILLLYSFLCCNGLDMFLCTSVIFKYVLPAIWQSIMNTIYLDFCSALVLIGNDANFCDDLTVEVALGNVMSVATALILILFGIFCMVNDAFKCLKHDDSPYYLRDQTSTWDYMKHRGAMRKSSTRNSVNDTSTDFDVGVVLGKMPYSSISTE